MSGHRSEDSRESTWFFKNALQVLAPSLLVGVGDVIVHHHDDLLVGNAIAVNNLVGVARVCLGKAISSGGDFAQVEASVGVLTSDTFFLMEGVL